MTLIIFAIFLSLLQNGLAHYTQFITLPDLVERSSPVYMPETVPQLKFSTPTTIVTDCTPSVRHNLGNLLQLMIVSDLLQTTNIGSTAAMEMALPIIRDVLSSPSLARICPDSLKHQFNVISSRIPNTLDVVQNLGHNVQNLLPNIVQDLSPNIVQNLSPNRVQNLSPNIVQNLSPNIVKNLAHNIAMPHLEVSPNLFLPNDLSRAAPNLSPVPNIIFQKRPVPVDIFANINTVLQNLPLDIETRPVANAIPPNIVYQNLPLPVSRVTNNIPLNTVLQNLPLDIETRTVTNALPPNIVYQNVPLPISTVSNNIPLNAILQNLPLDILETKANYLPSNIIYQNSPSPLNTVTNNIPSNSIVQNIPADIPIRNFQGLPARIILKGSPHERKDSTPNFVFQNTPIGNPYTISPSLPWTSAPNTKPVLKFLIRS